MEHDLSERSWGCNYTIINASDGGINITLSGWKSGICNGDFIILKNGDDTTRYVIDDISYHYDPHDMWAASATFSPRQSGV
jgi:hypothetical protein